MSTKSMFAAGKVTPPLDVSERALKYARLYYPRRVQLAALEYASGWLGYTVGSYDQHEDQSAANRAWHDGASGRRVSERPDDEGGLFEFAVAMTRAAGGAR